METVASTENLGDLCSAVGTCCQETADSVAETSASLERLCESAGTELSSAMQAHEAAQSEVARLESRIASLEAQLDSGDERTRERASDSLSAAEAELSEANQHLSKCEERRDKAAATARKASALRERFLEGSRTSLARLVGFERDCAARLARACDALERYAAEHPESFAAWARWTPPASGIANPAVFAERFGRISPALMRDALAREAERDPRFREKIEESGRLYAGTSSLAERAKILRQARINASGEFAERMVAEVFRPLGDVSTQNRTHFDDGRYTKTDLFVRNLRAPVLLGRGDRAYAPKGGSVAFEVKAGKDSYLLSQEEHLVFQAGGHRSADASATICTADIHDLPPDTERALRDRMREAGSPIIALLPRKRDIDRAIFEAVAYGIGKELK